jgi:hypothetical protein
LPRPSSDAWTQGLPVFPRSLSALTARAGTESSMPPRPVLDGYFATGWPISVRHWPQFSPTTAGHPRIGDLRTVVHTASAPSELFLASGAAGRGDGLGLVAHRLQSRPDSWPDPGSRAARRGSPQGRNLTALCLGSDGGPCQAVERAGGRWGTTSSPLGRSLSREVPACIFAAGYSRALGPSRPSTSAP